MTAHDEHMERIRAVHRRSAWERVLSKIAYYEALDRAVAEFQVVEGPGDFSIETVFPRHGDSIDLAGADRAVVSR